MNLGLEDSAADVVGKAIRGLGLTDASVAEKSGVDPASLRAFKEGRYSEGVARKLAPVLGLNPGALVDLCEGLWRPQPVSLEGLSLFNTPFGDMTVNSYLLWDPASLEAMVFDSGADASEMLDQIARLGLKVRAIFLTHTHGDHIFDLDRIKEKTHAPAFVGEKEPLEGAESIPAGRFFQFGALRIETRLTWGHSPGGVTYVVSGLEHPVAVVGDAIFAGSMGGGKVSYASALETNRKEILTLPKETILCPGHGPLTTVGEELAHNPFFA